MTALVWAGTVLGVTASVTDAHPSVEVDITDSGVTLSGETGEAVVVENMTNVTSVDVTHDAGSLVITTDRHHGLTSSQRRRATDLALTNGTVSSFLAKATNYEVEVDPVYRLNASSTSRISVTGIENPTTASDGETTFYVGNTSAEGDAGSVTVQRRPATVPGRAAVSVSRPAVDGSYMITVDLEAGVVLDVTALGDVET
ncbi:hypothetical protein ACKVMT_11225 [Halobacteriales archaeon Cl-PHB]